MILLEVVALTPVALERVNRALGLSERSEIAEREITERASADTDDIEHPSAGHARRSPRGRFPSLRRVVRGWLDARPIDAGPSKV